MTEHNRRWLFGDGYGEMDDDPEEEAFREALDTRRQQQREATNARRWAVGLPPEEE